MLRESKDLFIQENENTRFCVLSQEWLQYIQPQVKESTHSKYRNLIRSYIIPEFRSTMISDMTPYNLSAHCNHLLSSGGKQANGLSTKTVIDILSVVRRILKYCQQKGISVPCTGEEYTIKQTPKELSVLSHAEQARLYQYLIENISARNLGVLLSLLTGLRIGEVCALRWEDISLSDETIHVHHTMQRIQIDGSHERKTAVVVTTPKSSCSIRSIPIPSIITDVIRQEFSNRSGYVLTGCDNKWVEPRTMQNHFKRILSMTGIKQINYHALRHTFAIRCVEVGFDVKSLSEILGHANVNITMNRYVHPTMEMKKENMERLSAVFLVR